MAKNSGGTYKVTCANCKRTFSATYGNNAEYNAAIASASAQLREHSATCHGGKTNLRDPRVTKP